MLKAGSKKEIKITFCPVEAKVIIASAVFKFIEGEHTGQRVLKMSGIGKFPFVTINHEKLDFESLTVGKEAHKTIQLRNYSLVKAEFNIDTINDDGKDASIKLSSDSGVIEPGASTTILVTYSPTIVGQFSSRTFEVNVVGGNKLKLVCVGQSNGIDVGLSSNSIHFGEVQLSTSTNRLLNIINDSD